MQMDRSFDPLESHLSMPRTSARKELLDAVNKAALALAKLQFQNELLDDLSDLDTDSDSDPDSLSTDDDDTNMSVTDSSPTPPSSMASLSGSGSSDSSSDEDEITIHYDRLQHTIDALRDEVQRARVIHKPDEPPPRAPQLHMLVHHEEHRPELFRQKLRVNPEIFDDILDQISDHPIFQNNSNNPQLPVSIQLAIFLNRAGHYGNAITVEDVAQWAGVSVGSVVNCTNRVMVALLEVHDQFISFPEDNSEDAHLARKFAEVKTCPEWKGGYLAVDGSTVELFTKPGYYGEVFFDRKSNYSLGCQVKCSFLFFLADNLI